MKKIMELIHKERVQYLVYAVLSIGVLGLTGIIYFSNDSLFHPYLGNVNPLVAFCFIISIGIILLSFLLSKGWFVIYKKENLKGMFRSYRIALLLGLIIILVDLKIIFPIDMNVVFPKSLLFYPAIGFFVEILFHILPLCLLLIFLTSVLKKTNFMKINWICILLVSLIEPIYQTIMMGSSNQYPLWAVVYTGFHVLVFNLFQLSIFKRYDFISMYTFRIVYYLIWHIGWGYIRLKLLF